MNADRIDVGAVLDLQEKWEQSVQRIAALELIIGEYAAHQSWRCNEPARYPWKVEGTDCMCGLTEDLRKAGMAPEAL